MIRKFSRTVTDNLFSHCLRPDGSGPLFPLLHFWGLGDWVDSKMLFGDAPRITSVFSLGRVKPLLPWQSIPSFDHLEAYIGLQASSVAEQIKLH
ncbi:hypothetical protein AVEN_25137-1 [Araneus ventricosus]|uniref:Uncharacterized protein n=1 Tax=Araneus ventricosus TaxID=182803 RepID=A0A4Y2UE81_ARAVE|nr:hypothetical protein AVEN_25137-1 [Araneus ventricosus]